MTAVTTVLVDNAEEEIALVRIDSLKPHEKGLPLYLERLKSQILNDNVIRFPVVADRETGVIFDGMHRWLTIKSLGYTYIPAILVDVQQREKIRIGTRRVHRYGMPAGDEIPIHRVLAAGLRQVLMPPRTTRHFFPFSKNQRIDLPLDALGKREPKDVSMYLASMTAVESKLSIRQWLDEIDEEQEYLMKRKLETDLEKQELLRRIAYL